MRNILKRYLWIFIIIFSLLSLNNSSYSTLSLPLGKVEKEGLNIRTDSTITSPVIGKLTKNEYVEIIKEKYGWYKIRLPKRFRCYVYSRYLRKIDKNKGEVSASSLNVRSGPSLNAPIIGKVKKGDILNTTKDGKEWVEINCYPYAWGWVYKPFVKLLPKGTPEKKEFSEEKEEKKGKEKVQEAEKKSKEVNSQPYIAKGKLKRLKREIKGCKANYILENETGFLLLRIASQEINPKNFLGKEIKIWGGIESEKCVYINVERIAQ